MWIFITPPARPDASQWPGRRMLALLDALVWPALWIAVIAASPFRDGVIGWTAIGLVGVAAARRAYRAILRNERYWFTTSRWGVSIATLITIGLVTRLLA